MGAQGTRTRTGFAAAALLLGAAGLPACADREAARLRDTTRPTYDRETGRLTELTYDANRNGRVDTWTEMDGSTPLRSRIDRDEDGRIDRWEYFDAAGALVKVGYSRRDDGRPDAWAYADADGRVSRIEASSTADEEKIDRWEHYAPGDGPDAQSALVRVEEDTNGDGRADKRETYRNGTIESVAFDADGDGVYESRLTYEAARLVLIESDPDASGRFTRRRSVK